MTGDEAELQAESAEIERLLEELRELVPLPAWQRVEEVLRRVVRLYGEGLSRALDHARAAGATGELDTRLCDDELLASLLVLHGLHPMTTEQRLARALASLRAELQLGDDELAFAELADGVVVLTASRGLHTGAMSTDLAQRLIQRALEIAAPEITGVRIDGVPVPRDPSLVQLRTSRPSP
ncbi:MAG TPA: hypothetical protein VGF94_27170 [Kofleriaceae bacterium]